MGPGTAVGTSLPSAKTKLGAIAVAKPATINSGKSASSSNSIRQGEDRAARLCGCAIKTKLRVTAQRQSERSDQPPLSGPGGMLVQGRPFRQRGRRSRSAGSGALEAEWCANGLYCAFRTQNWYMPTKVDGFSISKSCQRARLVIVLSVGKRPRKFCSTLPGKWNPRKSS